VATARPRVLLAEDHAANARLLWAMLEEDFDVVGAVDNGRALVDAAAVLLPDVIVTDIAMPLLDGIAATREILKKDPGVRVVFVTVHADPVLIRRGWAAGGLGYVPKPAAGDELVPAVWAVLKGKRWCLCSS
jgi:DNA-binding NarL/FixJ family response regulator